MKKVIAIIAAMILVIGLLSGCMLTQDQQMPSQTDMQPTETPSPSAAVQQSMQSTVDESQYIGEDRAKEAALQKAEISADGVIFDRVELDNDDGIWHYEVEFRQGRTEYDVTVKADDGTILKYEKDIDD